MCNHEECAGASLELVAGHQSSITIFSSLVVLARLDLLNDASSNRQRTDLGMNIEDCISAQELSELLGPMKAGTLVPAVGGVLVHGVDFDEIADLSKDDFAALHAFVLAQADDFGRELFLTSFQDFRAFFDWLDTVCHYDQEDAEMSLAAQMPWLAVIYMEIKRSYSYENAATVSLGRMICTTCHEKIFTGKFRSYELPDVYVVQHRACSDHDPQWAVLDKEEDERKAWRRDYVAACREFNAKWNTSALDEEIAQYSV